ncbi:hypothetical protein [Actinomadura sp. 9N407]|uniref:hypothetical protein n=1 Tax=Actinomadura sp. 9N407 TaxID=3375154 RepID=UPI0037AE8416
MLGNISGVILLILSFVAYKKAVNAQQSSKVSWTVIALINFTAGAWLLTLGYIKSEALAKLAMFLFLAVCVMGIAFVFHRLVVWLHEE